MGLTFNAHNDYQVYVLLIHLAPFMFLVSRFNCLSLDLSENLVQALIVTVLNAWPRWQMLSR